MTGTNTDVGLKAICILALLVISYNCSTVDGLLKVDQFIFYPPHLVTAQSLLKMVSELLNFGVDACLTFLLRMVDLPWVYLHIEAIRE